MFIFHGTTKFWKTLLMWPCGPSPNHFRGMPSQDILSSFVNDLLVLPMIWKAIRVCNVLKTWHTTWPARVLNGMSESAVSKKCDDTGHLPPYLVPLNHLYWWHHQKSLAHCNFNSKRQSTLTNQSLKDEGEITRLGNRLHWTKWLINKYRIIKPSDIFLIIFAIYKI